MPTERALRLWPVTLLVLLLPLWSVGMFGRWYWTPDEPREAAIAWSMVHQAQKAVPELAGTAFCEKPPLTYWASGTALALGGKCPAMARLPNLLWAIVAVLAVAWLAHAWAGPAAAITAGLALGTCALSYQVSIWLATDAPLVAGVSLALLGLWRGLTAGTVRARLGWYLLMHGGLVLGFLAKNIIAWVIPGLAFIAFIAWERRWRELARWELWLGFILQAAVLLPWVLAVAELPDGRRFLRIFFWDNLVGRFLPVASEGNYRDGHNNFPGKYLLELPVYLAPWLFLALAAGRRAWAGVRAPTIDRPAWRFIACVILPATLLLSASSTARNVYYAPVMPGFALAVGLWAARHLAEPCRFERLMLWLTAGILAIVGFAIGPACLVALHLDRVEVPGGILAAVVVGGLAAAALAVKMLWFQRHRHGPAMLFTAVLLVDVALLVAWRGAFPAIDRRQDLTPALARVAALAEDRPLAVWQPDETIVANLDYLEGLRVPAIADEAALRARLAADPRTLVLIQRKGRRVEEVAAAGLAEIETVGQPGGRMYTVMGAPPAR